MAIKHSSSNIAHTITTKRNHMDRYVYKNENKYGSYQPLTTSSCRISSLLPFARMTWMIKNENQAPGGVTDGCWIWKELYKTKKNNKYFWCFRILKQSKEEANKKENIFWVFWISTQKSKRQNKTTTRITKNKSIEKQRKYFWYFWVLRK